MWVGERWGAKGGGRECVVLWLVLCKVAGALRVAALGSSAQGRCNVLDGARECCEAAAGAEASPHLNSAQPLPAFPPLPQRHMPNVGFFQPIGAEALPHTKLPVPKHVAVLREHFGLKDDPQVRNLRNFGKLQWVGEIYRRPST